MSGSARPSKVELVPWDPTSEQHFKRMVEQRFACGWDHDEVTDWKNQALRGDKYLYWIKPADNLANKDEILKAHFDEFPSENSELVDSATTLGGKERTPSQDAFFPIGHIGLQIGDARTKTFSLPLPKGAIWIKSLYISFPLQSQGLGRSSMQAMENLATQPPLNANFIALDTVERSYQLKDENLAVHWEGRGRKRPEVLKANQEWYMRQGYEAIKVVQKGYVWVNPKNGESRTLPMVFLKKNLA